MNVSQLEVLVTLRAVIGYLGERDQHSWWQSSFLSPTSRTFLTPVFARTELLAQYSGVTRAAAQVHDARIGVGSVFHLFRLPEDLEQRLHHAAHDPALGARIRVVVRDQEAALAHLRSHAAVIAAPSVGPTRVGDTHDLRSARAWQAVAGQYAQAFSSGAEMYPYFTEHVG